MNNDAAAAGFLFGLIIRVLFCIWARNIARQKNRSTRAWGFWTFISPWIGIIAVYCVKTLPPKVEPIP